MYILCITVTITHVKENPPPQKKPNKKTGYIFETFVCGLGDNVSYIYKFIQ
jgi:hypothetical protein